MKKTVLAVDDSKTVLNMLDLYLKASYHLICTTSGDQALQIIQKQSVDIILLDMMMPVMSGLTVLRKLREKEKTRDIPVLCLTGNAHKAVVMESYQEGAQGYLLKPVAKEELIKRINETIEKQEQLLQKRKEEEKKKEEEKQAEEERKQKEAKNVDEVLEREEKNKTENSVNSLLAAFEDTESVLESFVMTEDE